MFDRPRRGCGHIHKQRGIQEPEAEGATGICNTRVAFREENPVNIGVRDAGVAGRLRSKQARSEAPMQVVCSADIGNTC